MKILCVEDGSVDVDAIERDDLKDGKVLLYRQGATPPFVLDIPEGESVWKGVEEFCKRASDMATEPYKQEIAVLEKALEWACEYLRHMYKYSDPWFEDNNGNIIKGNEFESFFKRVAKEELDKK